MAAIELRNLTKQYGSVTVIPSLHLDIHDQEFVVFVGPSGCGKSTLLRIIAGLEPIDGGELRIGGVLVNDVPAAKRDIAMVFQDYALYPHMTVYENMAFGLRARRVAGAEIDRRVKHAAAMLHIDAFLPRRPKALSGGQRQRVAMGRAMVREPKVFLFDEPLSNLDAKLRAEVRTEIKALAQQLKTTMIFVTHDQVEAMTLADRIVVLKGGVIQQVGTPVEIYNRPENRFVASFIGSPAMNFFQARLEHAAIRLADGSVWPLSLSRQAALRAGAATGGVLGVRPEHMEVWSQGQPGLRARLSVIEPLGSDTLVYFEFDGNRHVARVPPELAVRPGDMITLGFSMDKAHLFDGNNDGHALR